MEAFLDPSEFTPTQWNSAADKAEFGNKLLNFIKNGFTPSSFTTKLYSRLCNCFGLIAHFDKSGFASTWFDGPESIAAFVNHLMKWSCCGDPAYTYSDVEKAVQREVERMNLVQRVNVAAEYANHQRELALLETLEKKYRKTGNVIEMPRPVSAPAVVDDEPEQLTLIA